MTKQNDMLSGDGKAKRDNLKKLVRGTVYAIPVVAAFSVGDMITNEANAYYGGGGSPTGGCNNGFGNGDQCAPGNSFSNNAAENDGNNQQGSQSGFINNPN